MAGAQGLCSGLCESACTFRRTCSSSFQPQRSSFQPCDVWCIGLSCELHALLLMHGAYDAGLSGNCVSTVSQHCSTSVLPWLILDHPAHFLTSLISAHIALTGRVYGVIHADRPFNSHPGNVTHVTTTQRLPDYQLNCMLARDTTHAMRQESAPLSNIICSNADDLQGVKKLHCSKQKGLTFSQVFPPAPGYRAT